jgi:hypothetical protein
MSQGHLALALQRFGDPSTPAAIMASLAERSVRNEEFGMFWKESGPFWIWSYAPIETQALMIEAFDEITGDQTLVEECRVWLLKQKQTQNWRTTKATCDAVYALLAKDLDGKAAGDAGAAKMLQDGIAWLNKSGGGNFAKASEKQRNDIVRGLEGTAFFATVRGQCITSLYDNDMAYAVFGYPGSAWEKGGYITRGFQDLKWLPAPPKDASPAPYLG